MACISAGEQFAQSAHLVAPIDIFESPASNARAAALKLLRECERLSGAGGTEEFERWLGSILRFGDYPCCFYGNALAGSRAPSDVDMMSFVFGGHPMYIHRPAFVHILSVRSSCEDPSSAWGSFFLGPLLFPGLPPEFVTGIIERGRKDSLGKPFFKGGIGEPLTYAAYRCIGDSGAFTPEEWDSAKNVATFKVQRQYFDSANFQTLSYSVTEVHDQVRKNLATLGDAELAALAKAAMRRAHVRAEKREELAERFVSEIRRMRP
ncbi:MAG: hypothetical protein AB1324_05490 [Candidatus Micrarchaeota archaeon]